MLEFGIKDFIDILLVAIILYYVYRVMKQSRSVNIFYGLLLFVTAWIVVSKVLEMKLLGTLLDQLVSVGTIAIIILFQDEIRHFFNNLGAHERAHRFFRFFRPDRKSGDSDLKYDRETIIPIVMACLNMSKQKVGALIVMQNSVPLNDYVNTGDVVDARIGQRIIENIFFKNSPLHDGAMIISGMKIRAAGCLLPVAHDQDIPNWLGLRHRAALGITQVSDAMSIVVSEETGGITVARQGSLSLDITSDELDRLLIEVLSE